MDSDIYTCWLSVMEAREVEQLGASVGIMLSVRVGLGLEVERRMLSLYFGRGDGLGGVREEERKAVLEVGE